MSLLVRPARRIPRQPTRPQSPSAHADRTSSLRSRAARRRTARPVPRKLPVRFLFSPQALFPLRGSFSHLLLSTGFSTFCTETLPKLVGSASATASQTSSSMTTSTRSAAGAASSTSAPASQITSSNVAGSAAANQAPSASASVTSGAGRVTAITTGAVAGAVVSLLVAFAF